jgi:hypothetical protein
MDSSVEQADQLAERERQGDRQAAVAQNVWLIADWFLSE